ncbi:MAG: S46 family peptidase, partial [Rhodanobacteraceae bacterium]
LVFAPSQQTSFFGGYPDNFNYPRYDYDVAIVRVYVDGKPARTPEYFHFSAQGPKADELVFTSGNPGSTERDFTVAQLKALRYPVFPDALQYLGHYQGLLEAFSAGSSENARIAQGTLFFVNNSIKSIDGQLKALNNETQFTRKEKEEAELRAKVKADPKLEQQYGDAWANIATAQKIALDMGERYGLIVRGAGFNARLFQIAFTLVLGAHERTLPEAERIGEYRNANLPGVEQQLFSPAPVYPNYDRLRLASSLTMLRNTLGTDAPIAEKLFATESPEQVAHYAVDGSGLADVSLRKQLWNGGEKAVAASDDPMIALAREVLPFYLKHRKAYEDRVAAVIDANTAKIARARFALFGTSIAPDATFTERVSYGVVKGWPRDGKEVAPFTDVAGLYKHAKGYPPLQLTEPWLQAKDRLDPATPVNFVTTNDIVGGNSGSPVINREGMLVGLIFDGNPPSLGGAFWYDDELNRAVAVDSAFILAGLRHVYGANALADELTGGK